MQFGAMIELIHSFLSIDSLVYIDFSTSKLVFVIFQSRKGFCAALTRRRSQALRGTLKRTTTAAFNFCDKLLASNSNLPTELRCQAHLGAFKHSSARTTTHERREAHFNEEHHSHLEGLNLQLLRKATSLNLEYSNRSAHSKIIYS